MDTKARSPKYAKLSRPHRKLNFLTNKERSDKQWGGKVTLEDVDKLFDDLNSSSDGFESIIPLSPMHKTTSGAKVVEKKKKKASPVQKKAPSMGNIQQSPMGPKGFQQPTELVENSEQNLVPLETGSPFVEHGPIETSSPLERKHVDERFRTVSPILFPCDDDADVPEEEPKTASPSIERAQSQGPIQPSSEDLLDASPNAFFLAKAKTLRDDGDVDISREPDPVTTKSSNKSQSSLESQTKSPTQDSSVSCPEPQLPSTAGSSQPAAVKTPRARKEHASSFLQKLRETGQSKSPWKSLKEPSLPEEEPEEDFQEDFQILEDDRPVWFSIPRKKDPSASKPRPAQQTTNNNNDGEITSSDQGLKRDQSEKAETQNTGHGGESANLEEGRTVNKKKKKKRKASIPSLPSPKKSTAKKKKTTTKGKKITTEMAEPEPSPASDLVDHEKKKTTTKGKKITTEMAEPEPSPASDLVDHGKDHEKKKTTTKGKKITTEMAEPEPSPASDLVDHGKDHEKKKQGRKRATSSEEAGPSDASQAAGKPRRKRPGARLPSLSSDTEDPGASPALKAPKRAPERPRAAGAEPLPAKTTQAGDPTTNKRTSTSAGQTPRRKRERKARPNRRGATGKMVKRGGAAGVTEKEEIQSPEQQVQQVSDQVLDPGALSPEDSSSRLERLAPAQRLFDRTYQHPSKRIQTNEAASIGGAPEPEGVAQGRRGGRMRKIPGEWWMLSDVHPDADTPPTPPRPQSQGAHKRGKPQSKRRKPSETLNPVVAKTVTAQPSPTPSGVITTTTARSPSLKWNKMFAAPKKRSLATFQDVYSQEPVSPPGAAKNAARERFPGDAGGGSDARDLNAALGDLDGSGAPLIVEAPADSSSRRPSWPSSIVPSECTKRRSDSMLNGLQSGPSNKVDFEQHEENEDIFLPTTRTKHSDWLSLGLYAPPLVPMVLQDEDEANLKEWLSVLWPVPAHSESCHTGPEGFEWFCHRGRAIGLQVDMCSESLCNGKILLGSYMKKPLWVDHCATTVFYMSTGCVVLTLDATDSRYSPGQSFVVPCGHAYSIKNQGDEPAVMFFSWVHAESPE